MKEIRFTKEEQKGIKEILSGCVGYIVLSNKGEVIQGTMPMIMTMITSLLTKLYKEDRLDDEILDNMVKMIKKPEDIDKMILEEVKKMLENMKGGDDNGE